MTGTRTYPAKLRRVIDGDTYLLDIDLGFYVTTAQHIRLRGVNAPEIHGASKEAGARSRWAVIDLLLDPLTGQPLPLAITTHKDERSFERWVADVVLPDGTDLAAALLAGGYAEASA